MKVLDTERLSLRWLSAEDAPFILGLLNEPSWLRFIGDKNVHSLEDARAYIAKGPVDMYRRLGFGLYLVELRKDGAPIGLCGLIKRDSLEDVDLGFSLLPAYWGQGFAREAAEAVIEHGRNAFGLRRLVAITNPDNWSSIRLLERLGFTLERAFQLPGETTELKLFARAL